MIELVHFGSSRIHLSTVKPPNIRLLRSRTLRNVYSNAINGTPFIMLYTPPNMFDSVLKLYHRCLPNLPIMRRRLRPNPSEIGRGIGIAARMDNLSIHRSTLRHDGIIRTRTNAIYVDGINER